MCIILGNYVNDFVKMISNMCVFDGDEVVVRRKVFEIGIDE